MEPHPEKEPHSQFVLQPLLLLVVVMMGQLDVCLGKRGRKSLSSFFWSVARNTPKCDEFGQLRDLNYCTIPKNSSLVGTVSRDTGKSILFVVPLRRNKS